MPNVTNDWDRQDGEGHKLFGRFVMYRDLGPARSLSKVKELLGEGEGVTLSWLEQTSARWNWVARARAYDDFLDRVRQVAFAREAMKMNARHAKAAAEMQEALLLPARALIRRIQRDISKGTPDAMVDALSKRPAVELLPLVTRASAAMRHLVTIERQAQGQPGEIVASPMEALQAPAATPSPDDLIEQYGDAIRELVEQFGTVPEPEKE